jgi:uncharacterized protein YndB with AHSA1/START domain
MVVQVDKDYENLTIVVIADFDAPIDRVWELWSDPRKLERWWGPPGYPATFAKHELEPGGDATYFMTSPDGERSWGAWRVTAVDPPRSLEFTDAFADEHGTPLAGMPSHDVTVQFTETQGGTRMTLRSQFQSREDMEKLVDTGMVEGVRDAVGQMDAVLAA